MRVHVQAVDRATRRLHRRWHQYATALGTLTADPDFRAYLDAHIKASSQATYGMLLTRVVGDGDGVAAGQIVGYASARLYFGLRDPQDQPIDPTGMLGRWVGRPRLLPVDGTRARVGPPPTLACPAAADGR